MISPMKTSLLSCETLTDAREIHTVAPETRCAIATGRVMHFHLGRNSRIRILAGEVWLTESGRPQDFIRRTGECYVSAHGGDIVAQALSDSRICVS